MPGLWWCTPRRCFPGSSGVTQR
ncbi:hypothetical protein LAh3_31 [Aeromonas phage LAh3]|nr:hypothetical protein LAh3_31 [Aeromonas phage LAh3]QDH46423.1 hypothetical protein LAh4_33 [Aeromonas phage LAh4]QDH46476.1 hypothetical protein LAh5_34 [Aeromonas phage LAh5]